MYFNVLRELQNKKSLNKDFISLISSSLFFIFIMYSLYKFILNVDSSSKEDGRSILSTLVILNKNVIFSLSSLVSSILLFVKLIHKSLYFV